MGTHWHGQQIHMMGRELEVTFACSSLDEVRVIKGPPLPLPPFSRSRRRQAKRDIVWLCVEYDGELAKLLRTYPLMKRLVRILRRKGLLDGRNRGNSCPYCGC